jgi:hypothetical protein
MYIIRVLGIVVLSFVVVPIVVLNTSDRAGQAVLISLFVTAFVGVPVLVVGGSIFAGIRALFKG